jgi:glycosyltransferase involved in cell wall biosynthesis
MASFRNVVHLLRHDRKLFRKRLVSATSRVLDKPLAFFSGRPYLYNDILPSPAGQGTSGQPRFLTIFTCNPFLPSGVGTSILAQCDLIKGLGYALDALFYVRDEVTLPTRDNFMASFDRAAMVFPRKPLPRRLADGVTADCLDAWCGDEAVEACQTMLRDTRYAGVIVHQPWLSRIFEIIPAGTKKYLFMHDNFASRGDMFEAQGLERRHAWLSVSEEEQARCMRRADTIFAVQEEERALFARQVGDEKRVVTVKIPLTDKTHTPLPPAEGKLIVGIVASANENNRIAVADFMRLWEKEPRLGAMAELRIAGDVGCFVQSSAPSIRILGRVDNLDAFYAGVSVVVNPDCGGTGLKVKSLEALSYGRPLLCSRQGGQGLHSPSPYQALSDRDHMVAELVRLVERPALLLRMHEEAQVLFTQYSLMEEYVKALTVPL